MFRVITEYQEKHGYPPTQEEIALELNLSRATVREHLEGIVTQTHVYNLETEDNWYIDNDIINHNCRCVMVPWTLPR